MAENTISSYLVGVQSLGFKSTYLCIMAMNTKSCLVGLGVQSLGFKSTPLYIMAESLVRVQSFCVKSIMAENTISSFFMSPGFKSTYPCIMAENSISSFLAGVQSTYLCIMAENTIRSCLVGVQSFSFKSTSVTKLPLKLLLIFFLT